jgi:pimeloyl-ACP methyl ester carboxylesterase
VDTGDACWGDTDGSRWFWRCWSAAGDDAPAVVLVHGFAVSGQYMIPLAERLARSFRVLVPDLPGHGNSPDPTPDHVPDVLETAEALARWMNVAGVDRATFVGNSFGCQVIAALAEGWPERVERIVFVGPTLDAGARSFPRQFWRLLLDVLRERPPLVTMQAIDYGRTGPVRTLRTARHMFSDRIEDRLPQIGVPSLVMRGARDPLVPRAWAERCARLLPDGCFLEIPGVAHAATYSAPGPICYIIERFAGIRQLSDASKALDLPPHPAQ